MCRRHICGGMRRFIMIYQSIERLVGETPLVELKNYGKAAGAGAKILAKVEFFNPAGSVKDRVAKNMIDRAEQGGQLKRGATIIEPTSGNTGIGLAAIGAARGYRVILTMPETMSAERIKLIKAYGAEVILTEGSKGMSGAIQKAGELAREIPGSFIPDQFSNPANPEAHYLTTGPEIWRQSEGCIDVFVAGVGTGGTITGVGRYLKEHKKNIKIIAVEPAGSPVLSKGYAGPHGIQGIGAGFVPKALDTTIYDEVLTVTEDEAYAAGRLLGRTEGLLVGISSGAALHAAATLSRRAEFKGKTIVVLLPDTGDRYLSTVMFS